MPNLSAFLSYILLAAFTPGPNNIMAMTNAGKLGFRKALRFNLGVLIGFLGVMALCALMCALLFDALPRIEPVMKYVGAAYILWLAWTVYRDKPRQHGGKALEANSIVAGAMLQLINPKVILYGITAFGTFILPFSDSPWVLALFVGILSINGFAGTCTWALFGSMFSKLYARYRKPLDIVMALLLAYCAISLLTH